MMRTFVVLFSVLAAIQVPGQGIKQENGYYNVIGSKTIRPNSEYHAAISIYATSGSTSITATLQGPSFTKENGGSFLLEECKNIVQPNSTIICRFKVGDIQNGNYKLQITSTRGLDFTSSFPLKFLEKSYSVFIQTDRAIYEPGSTLHFRAIVLNPALKPAAEVRNQPLLVYITDGRGNRVKEWRNVEANNGVFSGELKLSSSPVLGNWNIWVNIHGQIYSKSIEVAEYILPKFIVDIQAPKHMTFMENMFTINVDTRYGSGKQVNGEATITVYPTISSGVIQPIFQNPIRKVVKINGTKSVDFNIEKDLGLNDEYERTVIIDVTVKEAFTGRRQNNTAEIYIHKYAYKMELIRTADYFKPGLKYTVFVRKII